MNLAPRIGIDLGTANSLVYVQGRGIVVQEPSVIALARDTGALRAVGAEAHRMIGRTPTNLVAVRPLRDGVIADLETTRRMLAALLDRAITGYARLLRPTVLVGVPSGVTHLERRALVSVVHDRARAVHLIEDPMAAALGAGVQIEEPTGRLIVDVGSGVTDIAVISLGGVVVSDSIPIAGDAFDEHITRYLRRTASIVIGERTAQMVKLGIGAAMLGEGNENRSAEVCGRDLVSGLPKTVPLTTADTVGALHGPVQRIVDLLNRVLERTPPELLGDIIDRGIVLTGGGALLRNLDERLRQATGIPVSVAPNALQAVALGVGRALERPQVWQSS